MRSRVPLSVAIILVSLAALACDKPTHENIDKWTKTERGPGKIAAVLADRSVDPDVRAHAVSALVSIDLPEKAVALVAAMGEAEREALFDKLVPRLWQECQIQGENLLPTKRQTGAKDALFALRAAAPATARRDIDLRLAEWLGGNYDARQAMGMHQGEKIVRAIGPLAAPKLLAAAKKVVENPEVAPNKYQIVSDELLKAVAATAAPEAVEFLLGLTALLKHPDETLHKRGIGALAYAFLQSPERPGPDVLVPFVGRLADIAGDPRQPGENANPAYDLIAAVGAPACLPPLVRLAGHEDMIRYYRAIQYGLACARTDAIVPLAEALRQDRGYVRKEIDDNFWAKAAKLGSDARKPALTLLGSASWVGRISGVMILAAVGKPEDAAAVRALAKDKAKLVGWFGKPKKGEKAKDPALGEMAKAVAEELEKRR